ncbi:putative het domain-containing protein [Rosellinia necatrix]|uniref:Putative het domain-containing protein n=1 Tax=Rosellinia necatrix TaxID=77044 RepID=A0A1S8A5W7_ROSNE|nr:putative het domain-containing protein [Rosellinia necatrix]
MASIYSNGYLIIAATHSADSRQGLLLRTDEFKVSGKTPGGEDYCLFFRERIDHQLELINGPELSVKNDPETEGYPTRIHYPLLTRA